MTMKDASGSMKPMRVESRNGSTNGNSNSETSYSYVGNGNNGDTAQSHWYVGNGDGVAETSSSSSSYAYVGKPIKRKNSGTKSIDLENNESYHYNHVDGNGDGEDYRNGHNDSEKRYENPSLFHVLVTVMASACLYSFVVGPLVRGAFGGGSSRTVVSATHAYSEEDCRRASSESYGFFNDVTADDWRRMKDRVKNRRNHYNPALPTKFMDSPMAWYQNNFEPDFTCAHERRVGGMGDGPKWVCDPHRLGGYTKARKLDGGNDCLVYSVGSQGNFEFEIGLQKSINEHRDDDVKCEIHVFDPEDYSGESPEGIFFHPWGLESSAKKDKESNYKSFQETVAALGHEGRFVDIFKIDCEGCEWRIYKDLLSTNVSLMQILVEVHSTPPAAIDFFETLQSAGYVTFHKEPNIMFGGGSCQEYAMVKLAPSFFE